MVILLKVKKEYSSHQFYQYFDSLEKYDFLDMKVETSTNIIKSDIFVKAVYNYFFEIIIYLSLKTLVYDINIFSEDISNKEEAYLKYIHNLSTHEGIKSFFVRYPFLLEQLDNEVALAKQSINIFKSRFERDYFALKEYYSLKGSLKEISFSQGDSHSGKKCVVKLLFDDKIIYYKPKYFDSFRLLSDVVAVLNQHNIMSFELPLTLPKEDYCWQLGVDNENSTDSDVNEVYKKFGSLACIAEIFSITDLHMENIIVSQNKLYLIDTETICQRRIESDKDKKFRNITSDFFDKLTQSVLSSGLFPVQYSNSYRLDVSGICGQSGSIVTKGKYKIEEPNKGNMRLVKVDYVRNGAKNIPKIDGGPVVDPKDYLEDILNGFDATYTFILKNKDIFIRLVSCYDNFETRLICRDTSDYGKFLQVSTNPKYLLSYETRHNLFSLFQSSSNEESIVESEIIDLMNGDIPYFTVDLQGHVFNSKRKYLGRLAEEFSLQQCIYDLDVKQKYFLLNLIRIAMQRNVKSWERTSNGDIDHRFEVKRNSIFDKKLLLKHIRKIFEECEDNALQTEREITWLNIDISQSQQWIISPQDNSLYSGLVGNALSYLYYYIFTKENKYLLILKKIIKTIQSSEELVDNQDFSVFLGKGGYIYFYYTLWIVLKEKEYHQLCFEFIDLLDEENLNKQKSDYISGLAGLLVVLSEIYKRESNTKILLLIEKIADILVSRSTTHKGYKVWVSDIEQDEILNGFSHGQSGIAYALICAWGITGNVQYKTVALSSIDFEDTRIVNGNWIDFRNRETRKQKGIPDPVYWCHGAAGIGMVRYKVQEILQNNMYKKDCELSEQAVLNFGAINSDCLCHGKLGNLELCMIKDKAINDDNYHNNLSSYLQTIMVHGEWKSGIPQKTSVYNLMLGKMGIAYQLLRFYTGYQVPSVLTLELPKESEFYEESKNY